MIEFRGEYAPLPNRCAFPEQDSRAKAARSLLDEWRIACANMAPTMVSLCELNSERGEEHEAGMLLNTDAALLEQAISRREAIHPAGPAAAWHAGVAG